MRRIVVAGFAAFALAVTGACAGDDASIQAYCDFSVELDSRDSQPSEEDFDRIIEVAPDEIKDDVETLVNEIQAGDQESEEAAAAAARLEAWEEDNCGRAADDSDGADVDAGNGGDGGSDSPDAGTDANDGTDGGTNGGTDSDGTDSDGTDGGGTGAEVEAEVDTGEDETTTTTA